jgi:hypothetical protein
MISELKESELMDVLEQATAKLLAGQDFVQPDAEWIALVTGILELPIAFFAAVKMALVQGRWRNVKNPKAYLRKVAKREAQTTNAARDPKSTLKIPQNVVDEDGQPLSYEGYIDHQSYDYGPVKQGGVWQARNETEEPIYADDEGRKIPEVNGRPVPLDLVLLEDDGPDATLVINWPKVGERAGLDAAEVRILELRRAGLTREVILNKLARDDEERRKYQTAWRQLDRHMDRVQAVLLGSLKKI